MATMLGRGGHHFAHGLVAERDHRLDEPAVLLLDDAFFLAGRDQGFDVLGDIGDLFGAAVPESEFRQRVDEAEAPGEGAHGQGERLGSGHQRVSQRMRLRRYRICGMR